MHNDPIKKYNLGSDCILTTCIMWFNFVATLFCLEDITAMICADSLDHHQHLVCNSHSRTNVCNFASNMDMTISSFIIVVVGLRPHTESTCKQDTVWTVLAVFGCSKIHVTSNVYILIRSIKYRLITKQIT